MARYTGCLLFLFLLLSLLPVGAGGIDDADERLYQAQLALAQKGDPRAQYFLGEMYEQGLGTKQNTEEALKWYSTAAERGDVLAKRKLSMRKESALEVETDKTPESVTPPPPAVKAKPRALPTQTAKTSDTRAGEEAKRQLAIKAAEREKRRAAVRAMILDRIRHPIGEPFE